MLACVARSFTGAATQEPSSLQPALTPREVRQRYGETWSAMPCSAAAASATSGVRRACICAASCGCEERSSPRQKAEYPPRPACSFNNSILTGQSPDSVGSLSRSPSINDMSFKSAKSIADSTGDEESFARSKSTNAFNVAANSNSRLLRSQNTVKNLLSYQTAQRRSSQSIQTRREERVEFVEQVHRIRKQLKTMHSMPSMDQTRHLQQCCSYGI